MTEHPSVPESQPNGPNYRSRYIRAVWLIGILSLIMGVNAFWQMQHDCPIFTWNDMAARIEMPPILNSSGIQLVGNVTKTRRYGLFHPGKVSYSVSGVTVLYEDHHYFFVETTPDGFFRSLIDKSNFPHIAVGRMNMQPLTANSPADAVDEAKRFLSSRSEGD